ncbi:oxidoreductase, partial [cyanobacterium TDX16]
MEIDGAKVLVTGASGGLGHAIARSLDAKGAELVLTGRRDDELATLAATVRKADVLTADLTDPADLDRLAAAAGDAAVVVANAGLAAFGRL